MEKFLVFPFLYATTKSDPDRCCYNSPMSVKSLDKYHTHTNEPDSTKDYQHLDISPLTTKSQESMVDSMRMNNLAVNDTRYNSPS